MAERPILFSGPMVRAILTGAKTVTRRMCQELPTARGLRDLGAGYGWNGQTDAPALVKRDERGVSVWPFRASRCGAVGDRLWVRESAYIAPPNFGDRDLDTCRDAEGRGRMVGYAASMDAESVETARDYGVRCTPSIHMPRWASRLSLDVVSVRVERLRDITEEEAQCEGVGSIFDRIPGIHPEQPLSTSEHVQSAPHRASFACLWDDLYADGAGTSWKSNPWVWRVEFAIAEVARG